MRLDDNLDPYEALASGMHADPETGFEKFRSMVRKAGFQDAFVATTPLVRKIADPHNLVKPIGVFFAPDFQKFFLGNPKLVLNSPNARKIIIGRQPISFLSDAYWDAMPKAGRRFYQPVFEEFKIRAFHLPQPIVFKQEGFQASVNLFDNTDQRAFREHLQAKLPAFELASTYYLTGFARARAVGAGREARLSQRERECLLWAAAGYTTDQISDTLNLSVSTVNVYIRRAQRKLGARNRTHACALAVAEGLIAP